MKNDRSIVKYRVGNTLDHESFFLFLSCGKFCDLRQTIRVWISLRGFSLTVETVNLCNYDLFVLYRTINFVIYGEWSVFKLYRNYIDFFSVASLLVEGWKIWKSIKDEIKAWYKKYLFVNNFGLNLSSIQLSRLDFTLMQQR